MYIKTAPIPETDDMGILYASVKVACGYCDCEGPRVTALEGSEEAYISLAINLWNKGR